MNDLNIVDAEWTHADSAGAESVQSRNDRAKRYSYRADRMRIQAAQARAQRIVAVTSAVLLAAIVLIMNYLGA